MLQLAGLAGRHYRLELAEQGSGAYVRRDDTGMSRKARVIVASLVATVPDHAQWKGVPHQLRLRGNDVLTWAFSERPFPLGR